MRWMLVALIMVVCVASLRNDQANTLVTIRGRAVIESRLSNSHQLLSTNLTQFTYPAEVIGYGEDGRHVKTIQAVPDQVLAAFDGQLLGSNRGEWGGELVFRDKDGVIHRMLEHNVVGIIPMPFGIAVFTGLRHLGTSVGAIYVVKQGVDQVPSVSLLHGLSGAPSDILWTTDDELAFTVQPGPRTKQEFFSPRPPECYLLDNKGELKALPCASIVRRPLPH